MPRDSGEDEWHVTTDRQRIVAWVEQQTAVPVRTDSPESGTPVAVVSDPEASEEEIGWEEFFDRFEAEGLLFRYREGGESGGRAGEVVHREGLEEREAADEKAVRPDPDEVESEQITASDTGEGEPVIFDRVDETGGEYEEGSPGRRSDRGTHGTPGPKVDAEERSGSRDYDAAMSESARDAEERAIVLDEVYEAPGVFPDLEDEYLVFRNAGEEPIDLGGWTVENDDGRSYVFPPEFALDPGQRVTLHSGAGTDTDGDLYWGAEEPVWDSTGDTVALETPGGDRVVYEPIKDG